MRAILKQESLPSTASSADKRRQELEQLDTIKSHPLHQAKSIPVRIDERTTIFLTPLQAADKDLVTSKIERYNNRNDKRYINE